MNSAPPVVSYDAGLGVLTVTFGEAAALDVDEVVDDVVLFFDGQELGKLVKLQALFPSDESGPIRTAIEACLGPTLGRRCLALVDADQDAFAEEVNVPRREWEQLRHMQWPVLHRSWRSLYALPALAPGRAAADRRVATSGSFLVVAVPDVSGEAIVDLPGDFAGEAGVGPTLRLLCRGRTVRLATGREAKTDHVRMQAEILSPIPLAGGAARFTGTGAEVTAEVRLRDALDDGPPGAVVVHLSQPAAEPAIAAEPRLLCILRDAGRSVRRLAGVRDDPLVAVSYAGVEVGRSADRIYWRNTGQPPIEVVVIREGTVLWARGFAKKTRRNKRVRVECHLRPEAVSVLAPNGRTDPEGGMLSGEGTVDVDGSFLLRLATVRTDPFPGELVDRLGLEVG